MARNVIRMIRDFNAGRDPERLAMKYRAMRGDAFAFLRGTCHLMAARLADCEAARRTPPAWICGDLHLQNFGTYKGDNRLVYFDLNDFDEAVRAPAGWEVVRLLASWHVAAAPMALGAAAPRLAEISLDAWHAALAGGKAGCVERETAVGPVHALMNSLQSLGRAEWLDMRTRRRGGKRRILVDGRHALAATPAQRDVVAALVGAAPQAAQRPDFFEVLDVARRIAGTGSLGVDRYIVLVRGKGAPDGHYLLDLKEARPSALAPHLALDQPRWCSEAHRVVALQQRCQAVSMAFLTPLRHEGRSYVLRALQPSEHRLALEGRQGDLEVLEDVARQMGRCMAWSHLRAGGREGAAIADEWVRFGAARRRRRSLLEAGASMARKVQRDWRLYCEAYDDGAFAP